MKLKIVSVCITLTFLAFVGFTKQHAQVRVFATSFVSQVLYKN